MRLDEYGRWVSDDGAYIWDETAQVWQPATVSVPLPPPPSPLSGAEGGVPGLAGGQTDWQSSPGSGSASAWPDASWGATGEYSLPVPGQATGTDPTSAWTAAQPSDPANSGAYRIDTGGTDTGGITTSGLGTGAWPVQPADPLDSGAYPLATGGINTGGFGTGGWQVQPGADPLTDTGASAWGAASTTGTHALWQPADTDGASVWSAAPLDTESISPSTGATPLWGSDPSTGTGGFPLAGGTAGGVAEPYPSTAGYAPTDAYPPGGEWAAAGLGDDDLDDDLDDDRDDVDDDLGHDGDDRPGFTPSGSRSASIGRRLPGGRRPFADDPDDDGLDEPRSGRLATLTRSRPALLGVGLVAVMLLGFLTFALLGKNDGPDTQQASTGTSGRYEEAFRRSYLDTCIQASSSNAADYCSCTLDKFEADFTQDEFVRLSTDPNGAESREAVRLVTESCRAGQ